jgi:hypothetical protein
MPSDLEFWIVLVIAVAAVVGLAIWAGNNVVLKFKGFVFRTADKRETQVITSNVKVAEGADLHGAVGRVVGKSLGDSDPQGGSIEVAKGMKVGGSVGEIVGLETGRRKK